MIGRFQKGFSLLEVVVVLAIFSMLLAFAFPSYTAYVNSVKIRSASESILSGLQLARNEALRLNRTVVFSLTDSLKAGCTLASNGKAFVVSQNPVAGNCNAVANDTDEPLLIQAVSLAESAPNVTIQAKDSTSVAATSVTFNGLGRVMAVVNGVGVAAPWISQIDLDIAPAGKNRALTIQISGGGQVRLCDPAVTVANDSRKC